jgi:hypothetical protein
MLNISTISVAANPIIRAIRQENHIQNSVVGSSHGLHTEFTQPTLLKSGRFILKAE